MKGTRASRNITNNEKGEAHRSMHFPHSGVLGSSPAYLAPLLFIIAKVGGGASLIYDWEW